MKDQNSNQDQKDLRESVHRQNMEALAAMKKLISDAAEEIFFEINDNNPDLEIFSLEIASELEALKDKIANKAHFLSLNYHLTK